MAVYCEFTEARGNIKLFVNPETVRAVRPAEFGSGTQIIFDAAHTFTVIGDIQTIINALQAAGIRQDRSTPLLDARPRETVG